MHKSQKSSEIKNPRSSIMILEPSMQLQKKVIKAQNKVIQQMVSRLNKQIKMKTKLKFLMFYNDGLHASSKHLSGWWQLVIKRGKYETEEYNELWSYTEVISFLMGFRAGMDASDSKGDPDYFQTEGRPAKMEGFAVVITKKNKGKKVK